ncbi:MAG TPA: hypothetical protein VMT46_02985 [Anaerolineaceae bacterium]|nr:hypothetical protein [Anaerolineaceae bacterium]
MTLTNLSLGILEGIFFFIYLLAMARDLKNSRFLGFSTFRLILLAAVLAITLGLAALLVYLRRRPQTTAKIDAWLLDQENRIPHLLVAYFVAWLALFVGFGLYKQNLLLTLNPYYFQRLLPFWGWALLLPLQFFLFWFFRWKFRTLTLPANTWDILAVILLLAFSFYGRLSLIHFAAPYQGVWDEVVTYPQALNMLTTPGLKPGLDVPGYGVVSYGDLLVYLTAAGETAGLIDGFRTQQVTSIQGYVSPPAGARTIFDAVHPSGIPLIYPRMIFSILNSLAPLGIYFVLRKYLKTGPAPAFGAAFVYAFLSREVLYYSAYILPDALVATLFVFMLAAVFTGMEDSRNRVGPYLIAGILAGLMVNLTIRATAVLVVPVLGFIFSRYRSRPLQRLFAYLGGAAGAFLLTAPYFLIDLPGWLNRVTGFSWYHILDSNHRFESVFFYLRGMFRPDFNSTYVNAASNEVGLGLLTGVLALLGLWKLFTRYPHQGTLLLGFIVLHLYSISPIVQRYTRHALVLYPLICIIAGMGLDLLSDWLRSAWPLLAARLSHLGDRLEGYHSLWQRAAPALVLAIFLLASLSRVATTLRYVRRVENYKVPQVQVAEYLSAHQGPADKTAILDIIPWVESDLEARKISFERVPISITLPELKARGFTYLVGSDEIQDTYALSDGTIWEKDVHSPWTKLAEFGHQPLVYSGYPASDLYLFIARIP